mgnify:CR=1 FL=1
MDNLNLIIDLHRDADRQGPGGDGETGRAIDLAGLAGAGDLNIADIGCGTGAASFALARELDCTITAIDFLPEFLQELDMRAEQHGLGDRVTTLQASMDALPLAENRLDAIWSEGAIYNMGFAEGVAAWRRFLKPSGILAVSELTWLTGERPREIEDHWHLHYPEVDTASAKMAVLEQAGYAPLGYFPLPVHCWLDNYYRPMQERFDAFLSRHGHSDAAKAVVSAEQHEIALFEKYASFVGYGYYIARKTGE